MSEQKPKRKSISKKLRFEVFKRDGFTCQYCGRMAPDVVLEVDHINPVANGGDNDILNLVTSCIDCNRGKGKRLISDGDELKLQQQQLKELSKRREQLQMMIEWRKELQKTDDAEVDVVESVFDQLCGLGFSEHGRATIKKFIKRYDVSLVCKASEIYISQCFRHDDKSFTAGFDYIGGICYNLKKQKEDPSTEFVNKFAYYVNKRFPSANKQKLRTAVTGKISSKEEMRDILDEIRGMSCWTEAKYFIEEVFGCQL